MLLLNIPALCGTTIAYIIVSVICNGLNVKYFLSKGLTYEMGVHCTNARHELHGDTFVSKFTKLLSWLNPLFPLN